MKITIEEKDISQAKRLLSTDDVFGLLWDIDAKLRGYLKYGTELDKEQIMEEIRDMIGEENLLDLWA
jgi:hypothetical protein